MQEISFDTSLQYKPYFEKQASKSCWIKGFIIKPSQDKP